MSILTVGEKKALRTYAENMAWFRAHYADLMQDHANKYVAINDGKVIDSDYNPDRLIRRLRDTYGQEPITTLAIEYVAKNDLELLL